MFGNDDPLDQHFRSSRVVRERPSAAIALAMAGGIVIVLAGLLVAAIGAILTFFVAGVGAFFGLIGVVWGVLIIMLALLMRARPNQARPIGWVIIVLAVFSWFGSFGGLLIGFILALVGGMLAVSWKPGQTSVSVMFSSGNAWTATSIPPAPASSLSTCSKCGALIDAGSKVCKYCRTPV